MTRPQAPQRTTLICLLLKRGANDWLWQSGQISTGTGFAATGAMARSFELALGWRIVLITENRIS